MVAIAPDHSSFPPPPGFVPGTDRFGRPVFSVLIFRFLVVTTQKTEQQKQRITRTLQTELGDNNGE